jgi:hypothetical protein
MWLIEQIWFSTRHCKYLVTRNERSEYPRGKICQKKVNTNLITEKINEFIQAGY